MENVRQDLRQVEKEECFRSRMYDEDVQVFLSGSSLVPVPTAGRVENEVGDDGQGLMDNPQMVVAPVFPVDTLLEEMGLMIFGMLNDEDVASCFRAYPKWQQWIMKQRTRFLFPEVVPFLLKYFPKTSLLECRKVCRSWKNGLDSAYQSHPQHLQVDSEDLISKGTIPELSNRLDSANKITSFLQDMESHPGNPFPGRKLVLAWKIPGRLVAEENNDVEYLHSLIEDYWNNSVIQLLDRFGHQVHFVCIDVWQLGLAVEDHNMHNIHIPEILGRCIEHLPNLKKLSIEGELFPVWENGQWEDEMRRMRLRLPQLENLETVEIVGPPDSFIESILESCCNPNKIKRVELFPSGGGFADAVYGFQNLEVLDARIILGDLERFRTLERLPPLRKVVLRFCFPDVVDWREFIDFQRLSTILEVFAGTLKDVKLSMTADDGEEELTLSNDMKGFRINLPNLERLSWENYFGPLDPFIQLLSLRHLDFTFHEMQPWEGSEVQLYGFEERMESSNIWTLIPSLKTLAIKGKNDVGSFTKTYRRLFQRIICENEEDEMSQK